jgi:hypothetical protein
MSHQLVRGLLGHTVTLPASQPRFIHTAFVNALMDLHLWAAKRSIEHVKSSVCVVLKVSVEDVAGVKVNPDHVLSITGSTDSVNVSVFTKELFMTIL